MDDAILNERDSWRDRAELAERMLDCGKADIDGDRCAGDDFACRRHLVIWLLRERSKTNDKP